MDELKHGDLQVYERSTNGHTEIDGALTSPGNDPNARGVTKVGAIDAANLDAAEPGPQHQNPVLKRGGAG